MFTVPTELDEKGNIIITAEFTELDAYYTGLINFSMDQTEFKLARSEHIPIGNYKVLDGENQTYDINKSKNLIKLFLYII